MPRLYANDAERITRNVQVDDNGCWVWARTRNLKGYGYLGFTKLKSSLAHRFSYQTFVGPIPLGLTIDHLCRNRACVNPEHLEPVTQRENNHRSPLTVNSVNAAKTHCPRGHEYTPDNIYHRADRPGSRTCRTCHNADTLARYHANREENAAKRRERYAARKRAV
jgi:hypothetical protein